MPEPSKPHHIVVVGGGAGGLELISRLGRRLRKRTDCALTLIDASPTHIWKPLLHEVAAGNLDAHEDALSYLVHAHCYHYRFRLGRVSQVDRQQRQITTEATRNTEGHEYIPSRTFHYDTLILAVGSITNDYGIPGVNKHCHFLDHRESAERFHQHLLEHACRIHTHDRKDGDGKRMEIAIVGAGATGIELAAELHTYTRQLVRYGLDGIDPERDIKISIVDSSNRILPTLPERLADAVKAQLGRMDIRLYAGRQIARVSDEGLHTADGEFIPATIKVWAAGIKAPEFLSRIKGLEVNRLNQLLVRPTLRTTRDQNIFAFGDCAACPMEHIDGVAASPEANTTQPQFVPPRAQAAHQQAALLCITMQRRLRGDDSLPLYRYVDYGSLVNLSRYSTVGKLMASIARYFSCNVFIEGLIARLVYWSLYKSHQVTSQGILQTLLHTLSGLLRRRVHPRIKLH